MSTPSTRKPASSSGPRASTIISSRASRPHRKFSEGRVYVPVSSSEEFSVLESRLFVLHGAGKHRRPRRQHRRTTSGKPTWSRHPSLCGKIREACSNTRPAAAPSGIRRRIDAKRGAIYAGTGDGQTDPAPDTTDSVIALDLKTGKMLWHYQSQAGDAFMGGCNGDQRTDNCPKVNGPDQDIGNSPILRDLPAEKASRLRNEGRHGHRARSRTAKARCFGKPAVACFRPDSRKSFYSRA